MLGPAVGEDAGFGPSHDADTGVVQDMGEDGKELGCRMDGDKGTILGQGSIRVVGAASRAPAPG